MYLFSKYFSPHNFLFADAFDGNAYRIGEETFAMDAKAVGDDVWRLRVRHPRWPVDHCRSGLHAEERTEGVRHKARLEISRDGDMALKAGALGRTFLGSLPGAGFGVSGQAWMFQFRLRSDMQFYGMGEKSTPFEKSERSHRFWNTDVWADHGTSRAKDHAYDPDYISVPYVIVKRGNTYAGLLIDNPGASIISVSPRLNVANQMMATSDEAPFFFLGCENGPPCLYLLFGPSLPELTRKLQKLAGPTPLPPLWALGHQQCRWGYRGIEDLESLAGNFTKHEFPNDGLWLDIDYMDGYRVFTWSGKHFRDPAKDLASIQAMGFKVVPILDPGVKKESGFAVYESGHKAGVFCKNPAGTEFTGIVWPGYTVFPDFSQEKTQAWWAEQVAEFVKLGPDGVWLDMNDPSTGSVDCNEMLFQDGKATHADYHNQYASLMAEATRRGFLAARPDKRPFLISRSGFTGGQRFSAHWTGDNWSNYHHLHTSIGKSLNLALSGMPFNGPDVPGFGGNASPALFVDWYKASFLFPFLRNHCMRTSRRQEPWVFPREAFAIVRRYVRLRYKLLPYLYNLFIRHEDEGEAILRPLFYDFKDSKRLPLSHVNDQFLIGPAIMQAPFTFDGPADREVVLPAARWWRADRPGWVEGPARLKARRVEASTPLFLREGALIPMQCGIPKDNRKNLKEIELLLVLPPDFRGKAEGVYACDDGETFAYREGARTVYRFSAEVRQGTLHLEARAERLGFGPVRITPVTLGGFEELVYRDPDGKEAHLRPEPWSTDIWGTTTVLTIWK